MLHSNKNTNDEQDSENKPSSIKHPINNRSIVGYECPTSKNEPEKLSFTWKTKFELSDVYEHIAFTPINFNSSVLYNQSIISPDVPPTPFPASFVDSWNDSHVKMPCSTHSLYIESGVPIKRWNIVQRALSGSISSVNEFEAAVTSYNERYKTKWTFEHLTTAFQYRPDHLCLLNKISDLALQLPNLVTAPIPLLKQNAEGSISLSQLQIACLLANAFYCTFPRRNSSGCTSEYNNFPTINFSSLFSKWRNSNKSSVQKILCILHYFHRVFEDIPKGVVTFTRRCLDQNTFDIFTTSETRLDSIGLGISTYCLIEDAPIGMTQVNFANRFLGGGVLRAGCVQEEILCCIKPEILVGRLFIESLNDYESLIIEGAERFSLYSGYAQTFKWVDDYNEMEHNNSRDKEGRWKSTISVIDALPFRNYLTQFESKCIKRELLKAYCGFTDLLAPYRYLDHTIATGNWGCGAFNGNKELKALIQLIACAQAGKSIAYCTFADQVFADNLSRVYDAISLSHCTVSRLLQILMQLNLETNAKNSKIIPPDIFTMVTNQLSTNS